MSRIGKANRSTAGLIARFGADRHGAAAAEFALLLPVMMAVLGGIIQYGSLMYTYNAMISSARVGARALSLGNKTEAQVVATAANDLPKWVKPADWTIVAKDIGSTGTTQVTTRISVPAAKASIMTLVPMPTTLDITCTMLKSV